MMIQKQERLGRNLNFMAVYAIGTGTMIGAGIFVLPGIAIASAGPASVLSFLLGGLITLATTFSVVELATNMPKAGGSYYFISRALGPVIGTIIGLGAWMALIFKGSFALIGLAEYFTVFVPAPIFITAFLSGVVLIIINLRGSENSGRLQNVIVVFLLLILALFIIGGVNAGKLSNIGEFMPYGVVSVFKTTGLIFISYLGITQLAAISEEVKNPEKTIPRAFLASVITVTLLYVFIVIVVNANVPLEALISSNIPLVLAAESFAGRIGVLAITFAGFFATISTANAAILSSSRFPFAMARDLLLPHQLIAIHPKYKTPYRAILLTGVIILILLIVFNVESLAKLGATVNILIYVLVNLSVIIFRKSADYKPLYKDPFFPVTQIIGIGGSLSLLPFLGLASFLFTIGVIILGFIWFQFVVKDRGNYNYAFKNVMDEKNAEDQTYKNGILVALANPEIEKDLLRISKCLGESVIGLTVVKVPEQTDLGLAKELYDEAHKQAKDALHQNFCDFETECEKRYIVVFDHSIENAITEQAKNENSEMIIMGWQDIDDFQTDIGLIPKNVIKYAKSNVGILKGGFGENIKNLVVAFDGKSNIDYLLNIAERIAICEHAMISIVHIINPEETDDQKEMIKSKLESFCSELDFSNISHNLIEKFSPVDAIIELSHSNDLIIIGDTSKKFNRGSIANLTNFVARHSSCAVLIVKKYDKSSRYYRFLE